MKKVISIVLCFYTLHINSQNQTKKIDEKLILAKNYFYNNQFQQVLDIISDIEEITGKPSRIDVLDLKINTLIKVGAISFAKRQISLTKKLKISESINKKLVIYQDSIKSHLERKKHINKLLKIINYNLNNPISLSLIDSLTIDEKNKLNSFIDYASCGTGCLTHIPEYDYKVDNSLELINNSTNLEALVFLINIDNQKERVYRLQHLKLGEVYELRNIPYGKYRLNISTGLDLKEVSDCYTAPFCYKQFDEKAFYYSSDYVFTISNSNISIDLEQLNLSKITEKEFNLEK